MRMLSSIKSIFFDDSKKTPEQKFYDSKPEWYIEDIEKRLQILGYTVNPDGVIDSIEIQQIKNFQTQNGLKPDGLVGPATYGKLKRLTGKMQSVEPKSSFGWVLNIPKKIGQSLGGFLGGAIESSVQPVTKELSKFTTMILPVGALALVGLMLWKRSK